MEVRIVKVRLEVWNMHKIDKRIHPVPVEQPYVHLAYTMSNTSPEDLATVETSVTKLDGSMPEPWHLFSAHKFPWPEELRGAGMELARCQWMARLDLNSVEGAAALLVIATSASTGVGIEVGRCLQRAIPVRVIAPDWMDPVWGTSEHRMLMGTVSCVPDWGVLYYETREGGRFAPQGDALYRTLVQAVSHLPIPGR